MSIAGMPAELSLAALQRTVRSLLDEKAAEPLCAAIAAAAASLGLDMVRDSVASLWQDGGAALKSALPPGQTIALCPAHAPLDSFRWVEVVAARMDVVAKQPTFGAALRALIEENAQTWSHMDRAYWEQVVPSRRLREWLRDRWLPTLRESLRDVNLLAAGLLAGRALLEKLDIKRIARACGDAPSGPAIVLPSPPRFGELPEHFTQQIAAFLKFKQAKPEDLETLTRHGNGYTRPGSNRGVECSLGWLGGMAVLPPDFGNPSGGGIGLPPEQLSLALVLCFDLVEDLERRHRSHKPASAQTGRATNTTRNLFKVCKELTHPEAGWLTQCGLEYAPAAFVTKFLPELASAPNEQARHAAWLQQCEAAHTHYKYLLAKYSQRAINVAGGNAKQLEPIAGLIGDQDVETWLRARLDFAVDHPPEKTKHYDYALWARAVALIALMLDHPLRQRSLRMLQVGDFSQQGGRVWLRTREHDDKMGLEKQFPLGPVAGTLMWRYIHDGPWEFFARRHYAFGVHTLESCKRSPANTVNYDAIPREVRCATFAPFLFLNARDGTVLEPAGFHNVVTSTTEIVFDVRMSSHAFRPLVCLVGAIANMSTQEIAALLGDTEETILAYYVNFGPEILAYLARYTRLV